MSKVQFALVRNEEGSAIICYVPGRKPMPADDTHPNFERIVEAAEAGDPNVIDLFDVAETASQRFEALSERISVRNGNVFLDGDLVNDALTRQIVRFIEEDVDDWIPLVSFFEKVQANPNEHSREQLYTWLAQEDFTLTDDGDIVGYKSVQSNPENDYVSINSGKAMVDGEVFTGKIPNPIGAVVEMPRSEVVHDPENGCSVGLHVGTWDYASKFSGDTVLEVHVNPRDVVSVPTDSNWAKMRTCRYVVVDAIEAPYSNALVDSREDDEDEWVNWGEQEDDECEDCGCYDCECVEENVFTRNPGVYRGDIFRDRDSRRGGRTLTVEMIDEYNGVAKCRSSSSGKLSDVSIDRLLSRKYELVN